MTSKTLATMKTRIANELRRNNASFVPYITDAIETAIDAYKERRHFFNETRDVTFTTSANQEYYGASTSPVAVARLADLIKLDYVTLQDGSSVYQLLPETPKTLDSLLTTQQNAGQPGWYAWFDMKIRLYPIPIASTFVVRPVGTYLYAAPASDAETGNFWMNEAERLIRSRAKYEIATHVLKDVELGQIMTANVREAETQLQSRTNKMTQTDNGRVRPMSF